MVITVLEAHVAPAREAALEAAYREAAQVPLPRGLVRSTLLRATSDRTLWRIETLWESREALEAMRGAGTPRGVLMFRTAGAEPTLTVLEVIAVLSPPHGAA
jgi:heme-degrading monooxygenase HmoA